MNVLDYMESKYSGHHKNSLFPVSMVVDETGADLEDVKTAIKLITGRTRASSWIPRDVFFQSVFLLV